MQGRTVLDIREFHSHNPGLEVPAILVRHFSVPSRAKIAFHQVLVRPDWREERTYVNTTAHRVRDQRFQKLKIPRDRGVAELLEVGWNE